MGERIFTLKCCVTFVFVSFIDLSEMKDDIELRISKNVAQNFECSSCGAVRPYSKFLDVYRYFMKKIRTILKKFTPVVVRNLRYFNDSFRTQKIYVLTTDPLICPYTAVCCRLKNVKITCSKQADSTCHVLLYVICYDSVGEIYGNNM